MSKGPSEADRRLTTGLPSVSFLIPTLNAGKYIDRCLRSIVLQDYPTEKVETLVIDGGSIDKTLEISRNYPVRVVQNPWRVAESGLEIGVRESTGELLVVLAADNALPNSQWLISMVRPLLESEDVTGAFPFPEASAGDPPMNRYYCHIKTDPLTYFVFDSFGNRLRTYSPILKTEGYDVFLFPRDNPPLIAIAQGFVLRRDFAPLSLALDDVAPFCELVMAGNKLALVRETGILHLHLEGIGSFIKKYVSRAETRLARAPVNRPGLMNHRRILRMRIWLIYSLTLVWPTVDAIKGYRMEPDSAWFYHAFACFLTTLVNVMAGLGDVRRMLKYAQS